MKYLMLWRVLASIGFFGLIALFIIWNGWLSPVQRIPRSFEIFILVSPLLLFIRGVLYGRYSTHVKITFPAIIYFLLGVWYSLTPQEEVYGYLMIILSFLLYLGGYLYTRTIMKRDKALTEEV